MNSSASSSNNKNSISTTALEGEGYIKTAAHNYGKGYAQTLIFVVIFLLNRNHTRSIIHLTTHYSCFFIVIIICYLFMNILHTHKVSRKAHLYGAKNVEMKGKGIIYPHVMIRGDFGVPIRIGRYVSIGKGTILRPPSCYYYLDQQQQQHKFLPMWIGSFTTIGQDCIIEASTIGESVKIGSNVILGKRSVLKDCVYVESNTIVPPDMILPPFSIVSGTPARIMSNNRQVPESALTDFATDATNLYNSFVDDQQQQLSNTKHNNDL
jgi:dynactin-5